MADSSERERAVNRAYAKVWRDLNPERSREIAKRAREKLREEQPERHTFLTQKENARRRGIPWLLTFEEWWTIWQDSGKWEERGRARHQYVMARHGDKGAYEVGNVRICTSSENRRENTYFANPSEAHRKALSGALLGHGFSKETLLKMSEAARKRPPPSAEARQKMSIAGIRRQALRRKLHP